MDTRDRLTVLGWAGFASVLAARAYRAVLVTLTVAAMAPSLWGWQTYVVRSGSMEPRIDVGDVAHGRPVADSDAIALGRVYAFVDPASAAERTLLHRIVDHDGPGTKDGPHDHTWTSRGDANPDPDPTPVPRDAFQSRATLLVPWVGLPVLWATTAQWLWLALWVAATAVAFLAASRRLPDDRPTLTDALRLLVARDVDDDRDHEPDPPRPTPSPPGPNGAACISILLVLSATGVGAGTAQPVDAQFRALTSNSPNTWHTGPDFRHPYVRAVVADQPAGFWELNEGTGTTLANTTTPSAPGTVHGTASWQSPGPLPGPVLGYAASGPVTTLGTPVGSLLETRGLTIEFWFRTTATGTQFLTGMQAGSGSGGGSASPRVTLNSSGQITGTVTSTVSGLNTGAWHHVVLALDAGVLSISAIERNAKLYVNGEAAGTGSLLLTLDLLAPTLRIGQGHSTNGTLPFLGTALPFSGQIDAVALYQSELSATRAKAHYCAARPTASNCLQAVSALGEVRRNSDDVAHIDENEGRL